MVGHEHIDYFHIHTQSIFASPLSLDFNIIILAHFVCGIIGVGVGCTNSTIWLVDNLARILNNTSKKIVVICLNCVCSITDIFLPDFWEYYALNLLSSPKRALLPNWLRIADP